MVDIAKVKLVTIIASAELVDRLTVALKGLGATGLTSMVVSGRGLHGPRAPSAFDSGNIRLETIVPPAIGEKILEHVATQYSGFAIVAFAHDVDAVPRSRFD
jgi:nitrogen regulatory protein P-II 2